MTPTLTCKCIKDTTISGIKIGKTYKYDTIGTVYCIIYNETATTYKTLYGTKEWFYEHFVKISH